jgi:catechol 2,3-dioxygenase-like lactoylglutathione lyase family enzyme
MEHSGIVVDDLAAATEFFVELGLVLLGHGARRRSLGGPRRGARGRTDAGCEMQTPDGTGILELVKFHSPLNQGDNRHAPANTPGIRHIAFAVEDSVVASLRARGAELVGELERYEDSYRLCYVRGHGRHPARQLRGGDAGSLVAQPLFGVRRRRGRRRGDGGA